MHWAAPGVNRIPARCVLVLASGREFGWFARVTDASPTAQSAAPPTGHTAPKPADWARVAALTAFWGSAFAMIEVALETLTPAVIVCARMWIGALLLLSVAAVMRAPLPRLFPRPDPAWGWLAAVGIVGNTVPFFLIPWAQQSVTSGLTAIVIASAPLWVALLAHVLVPGERLTLRKLLGLAVAFFGVGVLFAPSIAAGVQDARAPAIAALLLASICYAVTVILARFSTHKSLVGGAAGVCLVAAVATTPLGVWDVAAHGLEFSARSGAALVALGVIPTAMATLVYLATARSAGPGFLSLTNYVVPLWAVGLGAVALGERLPTSAFTALALILAGLVLAGRRPKKL